MMLEPSCGGLSRIVEPLSGKPVDFGLRLAGGVGLLAGWRMWLFHAELVPSPRVRNLGWAGIQQGLRAGDPGGACLRSSHVELGPGQV
jgi:hypothetical protein